MDTALSRLVLSSEPSYRLTRHIIFWVGCVVFFGAIYSSLRENDRLTLINRHAFVEAILFLPPHMFLGYGIIYGLFPRYLFKGKYVSMFIGVGMLILATAFLSYLTLRFFVNPYREWQGLPLSSNVLALSFLAGLRGSNTVAGFMAAIKLAKHWYFKKIELEQLEKERLKAELELLKGQLQPHFLFNTLNNLYGLVLQRSPESPAVVLKLAELLHYMLTEARRERIPVDREIDILQHYIALERIRYGQRLDLQVHIDGSPGGKEIAPLILLPFIENAFKYGTHKMLEQPWISLTLTHFNNSIRMKLINSKEVNLSDSGISSTGIGLSNVKRRLELIYPGKHQLRAVDQGESYLVNLELQLEPA